MTNVKMAGAATKVVGSALEMSFDFAQGKLSPLKGLSMTPCWRGV